MADCVFCRIVKGDIPCWRVYEDQRVLAFMDINPVSLGHTLVIPKAHARWIAGLSEEDVKAVAAALRKIAPAVMKAAEAEGYNILNNCGTAAGQAVEHAHFHVIPRKTGDGRGYRWLTLAYKEGEAARLAEKIAGEIA